MDDIERQFTREYLNRIREQARQNARALGLSDHEWESRRRSQSPIVADILMAPDPRGERISIDGPTASARPLRRLRIDDLAAELREARRYADVMRLRQLLHELNQRSTKLAARLAASVHLSILALEHPDVLPLSAA